MVTNTDKMFFIFDYGETARYIQAMIEPHTGLNENKNMEMAVSMAKELIGQEIPKSLNVALEQIMLNTLNTILKSNLAAQIYATAFNLMYLNLADHLPNLEELIKNERIYYEQHSHTSVKLVICEKITK